MTFAVFIMKAKIDALFFMLNSELTTIDKNKAKQLRNLWTSETHGLSVEGCLAIRIDTLLTKNMYEHQYKTLKVKGESVFGNPQMEKKIMPWHVDYTLEKDSKIILEHSKTEEGAPIDVMHDFGSSVSHICKPKMCGV